MLCSLAGEHSTTDTLDHLFSANYAQPLARVMNKMLLISQVSGLAREIEKRSWQREDNGITKHELVYASSNALSSDRLSGLIETADAEDNAIDRRATDDVPSAARSTSSNFENGNVIDTYDVDPYTGLLSSAQKARISELLGK